MPLTREQQVWLGNMEDERARNREEQQKMQTEQAAAKKGKGKKEGDGKKKDGKKKEGKKKDKGDAKTAAPEKIKSKYKSPAHFMAKNFPTFDIGESGRWNSKQTSTQQLPPATIGNGADGNGSLTLSTSTNGNISGMPNNKSAYNLYNLNDITDDNYGPMRTMQMIECNRVLEVCEDWEVPMNPTSLHRALVIPQDKANAITIEQGLHNPVTSLMMNPLPKEYWKVPPADLMKGGKKKKGGGGKKKK